MVDVLAVPHPLQAIQTGWLYFSRAMVRRIPQKMRRTALQERGGQHFLARAFQPFVTVGHHILHAGQATLLKPRQKRLPAVFTFLVRCLHGQDVTMSVGIHATAICTARVRTAPASRTLSYLASTIR